MNSLYCPSCGRPGVVVGLDSRRRIRPSELGADRPSRGPGYASSPMENECRRCGRDVEDQRDWRPVRGGGWVCRWCVSGADDE